MTTLDHVVNCSQTTIIFQCSIFGWPHLTMLLTAAILLSYFNVASLGDHTWPCCQLQPDYHYEYYFKLYVIRTVPSARLIDRQVSIDHRLWYATVTHHSQSYCQMRKLKHEKDAKKSQKCALSAPKSYDLSIGTNCIHSQSHDTIPLSLLYSYISTELLVSVPLATGGLAQQREEIL